MNRQVNSGCFTPHTVSPMQHLQVVIVRNSKPLGFCFGEQESEPYTRNQMSDIPAHENYCYTLFFTRPKDAGALGKKSSSSLVFQYLYNIKVHFNDLFYVIPRKMQEMIPTSTSFLTQGPS